MDNRVEPGGDKDWENISLPPIFAPLRDITVGLPPSA